jgi:cell wall-associated NlpC family hydrolase
MVEKMIAGIVALAAAALVVGLVVITGGTTAASAGGGSTIPAALGGDCAAGGIVAGLSPAQSANAEEIVAASEGLSSGSPLAARIAVMTAYTESGLNDLGPMPDNNGSLGLFQQRASQGWGTSAEEEDPTAATAMFVEGLLALPGWSTISPWLAAQQVQRSAFADGSNYQANWAIAGTLVDQVLELGPADCGALGGAVPAGPAGRHGLPAGYQLPDDADPAETAAIGYALDQLGKPYVWGAAGPAAFDCSGLTMMAWAAAGYSLAHFTGDQLHEGSPLADLSAISPGDLVLVPGSDGTLASPGHVGIFIGKGLVESAVDPAHGVMVQTWSNFTAGGLSGIRHIA